MQLHHVNLPAVGPITLITAMSFAQAPGVVVSMRIDGFQLVAADCDETEAILASATLRAALEEADRNVAEGELVDDVDVEA